MSTKNKTGLSLTLVEWCNQQVNEGHELKITWDGGGDSGWAEFQIDGEGVENEYAEELLRYIDDELDYGSWAGEFSANGEALYSPEEKSFIGEDYYTEDKTIDWKVDAEIRIPKRIWFDNFHFSIDGYESPKADFNFFIKNGFRTPEHDKILEDLNSKMNEVIDDAIEGFSMKYEFRNVYENESIARSDFEEDGDDLVYKITSLNMGTAETMERMIYLNVEEIDQKLINS